MEKLLFKEEQGYNQWRLFLIMIVSLSAVAIPFCIAILQEKPFGDNSMSSYTLIVTGISILIMLALFFGIIMRSRLKTKITTEALFVCFPPLIRKWRKIIPGDIEKYEVRKFNPYREFGGHGIRKKKNRKAWAVSGRIGLLLHFKNGKKFLIGTQKKQAIENAIKKLMDGKD